MFIALIIGVVLGCISIELYKHSKKSNSFLAFFSSLCFALGIFLYLMIPTLYGGNNQVLESHELSPLYTTEEGVNIYVKELEQGVYEIKRGNIIFTIGGKDQDVRLYNGLPFLHTLNRCEESTRSNIFFGLAVIPLSRQYYEIVIPEGSVEYLINS